MQIMDLSGSWDYETDEENTGLDRKLFQRKLKGAGFLLPGSACQNQIGRKQEYAAEFTPEAVRAPRERYEYVGPLWLQRQVRVPRGCEGKDVRLFLERVNMASQAWVDGKCAGRQVVELSAPHCHDLTGLLTPGVHTITLRLDNRNLLNIGGMASGYSIDTQGIWSGVIGRMELQFLNQEHMEDIQVYPCDNGIDVKVVTASGISSPGKKSAARLRLTIVSPDGEPLPCVSREVELYQARQTERFHCEIREICWWNEFHPCLYRLDAVLETENGGEDRRTVTFGMRLACSREKNLLLNGRPIFLRGTTDCAIDPLTGYPSMEEETWVKRFSTVKEYGMNHVRFHAWCPPEAAFAAADRLGIYLSVEMPFWLNRDVGCPAAGEDILHRYYFTQEALAISKTYGNHPSFLMFSNGNEIMGDFELLEDIIIMMKAQDPRHLYTLTSNFDHPVSPCEDYLCAFEAGGHPVRLQHLQEAAAEHSCLDYREAVEDVPAPVVSFEVGQYCVFPDVDLILEYQGNMLPVNLEAIRREMIKNGIYDRRKDYIAASGAMAALLYKEDVETALRTEGFGGFSLLSLCDYTGQNTAAVGLLNAFWESKGILTPEEFRQFCGPAVPLFLSKRVYSTEETLKARLKLFDSREERAESSLFHLELWNGKELFFRTETREQQVEIPLTGLSNPAGLRVKLSTEGGSNSWMVYVYPEKEKTGLPMLRGDSEELKRLIREGGRAVVSGEGLKCPVEGSFTPVFWSPVFFPSSRPCGAIIDSGHPLFENFPTEEYPGFQWKALIDGCAGAKLQQLGSGFRSIVELAPNFLTQTPASPLFEGKVGAAEILFCGFDLQGEQLPVKGLRQSIAEYVLSDKFRPDQEISPETFLGMFF